MNINQMDHSARLSQRQEHTAHGNNKPSIVFKSIASGKKDLMVFLFDYPKAHPADKNWLEKDSILISKSLWSTGKLKLQIVGQIFSG